MTKTLIAVGLLVLALAAPAVARPRHHAAGKPATTARPAIALSIDTSRPGATIDRHIFGQFAEHLGHGIYDGIWVGTDSPVANTRGIRNDVVAALKAIKVPDVRWPGGCFADEYHWRRGIGPAAARPTSLNSNWGGVIEPNSFGTHEFMDFIDQIGSQAYVSGNVGSGSPDEMAQWLEYMTTDKPTALQKERAANGHPAPFNVPLLGIGNESWGCGGSMTAEYYVNELKRYATYAKNFNPAEQGDNHMLKIASGPSDGDEHWTDTVMAAWKDHIYSWDIDGLSLHSYSGFDHWPPSFSATGFDETAYGHVLKSTLRMEDFVTRHSAIMDKYDPDKKVALVVDEWGAWYTPSPGSNPGFLVQQNSQRDAILAALNLNIFARHADRVRMANIAQMINVLQAMILTDGPKMVLTPTYYTFRLYVPFQDATFIPVTYDAGTYSHGDITLPRLDAIAARDKDGKLWLSLTNLDPTRPLEVDASSLGFVARSATGQTLTSPGIDSVNDFDHPDTVAPRTFVATAKNGVLVLNLAPESVTVVELN